MNDPTTRPVWRYYDQATLDREYDPGTGVLDRAETAQRRQALSDAARSSLTARLDVSYGPTEPERLDVFLPTVAAGAAGSGGAGAPVFLFLHGGYWKALDARDSAYVAPALVAAGWCVVVVNYALAPAVTLEEIVRQCRAALAWTWRNAADFGGDPARIHVAGNSAGGHLGAMLLAPGWQEGMGLPSDVAWGATLLSGLYDLYPVRLSPPAGDGLGLDASETARRLSPIHALPAGRVRLLFSYAPNETAEFRTQTERYMAACAAAGHDVCFVPAPGTTHFSIPIEFGRPDSPLFHAVVALADPDPSD